MFTWTVFKVDLNFYLNWVLFRNGDLKRRQKFSVAAQNHSKKTNFVNKRLTDVRKQVDHVFST